MAAYVVTVAEGLSAVDQRRAVVAGPDQVLAGPGYRSLLQQAGFSEVGVEDVSDEYLSLFSTWVEASKDEADALSELLGPDEFATRQAERRDSLQAVRDGLLRRQLVTGCAASTAEGSTE